MLFLLILSLFFECLHGADLFEWFRSKGGYIHPFLELSTGPDPSWEVRGVFATGDIQPDERLIEAPPHLQICGDDTCSTIHQLLDEFEKGNTSEWWPYLEVLLDHDLDTIPCAWTLEQQDWLEGAGDLRSWSTADQLRECGLLNPSLLENKVVGLVGARSAGVAERTCMIPVYDMFNHRNGRSWNSSPNVTEQSGLQLLSFGQISKNEQVFNSFGYFTHDIFWRYGFIEQPARSWTFVFDGQEFLFAIEDDEIWWGQYIARAWPEGQPLPAHMIPEYQNQLELYRDQMQASTPDVSMRPVDPIGQKRFDLAIRFREIFVEALNFAIGQPREEHNEL